MYEELVKRLRSHNGWALNETLDEAADAIEDLEFACNRYEKDYKALCAYLPKWIPVSERLPEPYTWVLVFAEEHEVAFDAFYDGAQWKDAILNVLGVTHWMPLPEPPKEEENVSAD